MDTSLSLLDHLKQNSDPTKWDELVQLYTPLIKSWMLRHGANPQELDDVVQEVMIVVVRRFPEFERQPHAGAFRGWLRAITANCLRDSWKKANKRPRPIGGSDFAKMVEEMQDPTSGLSRLWDREHDQHVTQYLMDSIRHEFREHTWRAFELTALKGRTADEAAEELDITANAVLIAKSRVLARLRTRGEGLIEDL